MRLMLAAYLLFVLLGILMQAFYTGSEMSLYTVNRFRLRRRAHRGERSARMLAWLLSDPVGLLVTFLLGTNISVYIATALVTRLYERGGLTAASGRVLASAEVCATATLILPLFLSEVLTKNFVRRYAERTSYVFAWGLAATRLLLYPLVLLFRPVAALTPGRSGARAGLGLPQLSRNILHHLLSRGRETGELTAEQERLARNALRAGEIRVARLARKLDGSCCTPESEKTLAPGMRTLTIPAGEIGGRVIQHMAASRARLALVLDRLPGTPEGGEAALLGREVLGYVRLFDLLAPGAQSRPMRELARPVPRLPAQATLRSALNTMQRECADVALVEGPAPAAGRKAGPAAPADARPVLGVVRLAQLIAELSAAPSPRPTAPPTGGWPAVPAR